VAYERSALDHPVSLFDHARRLLADTPDGPLPDGGKPLPDRGASLQPPHRERKDALAALLREFISTPATTPSDLHDQCVNLAVNGRDVSQVVHELDLEPSPRLRETARWVIDTVARHDEPAGHFAIRIVVPDPAPDGHPEVEARILIDGVPIVAANFDKGPAEIPEYLLLPGRLRATDEPREVRLAEAYCTEGCCGGLYVTIVREGDDVVWKNWRSSMPGDPPPEFRFDAVHYDEEIDRVEHDHSWEWPARTVARLVNEQLRAEPEILARWDCRPGWCTSWLREFDIARLIFQHPAHLESRRDLHVQLGLVIDVADADPQACAAHLIDSFRTTDPKTTAEIVGGSRDGAEKLGLPQRNPGRWW
jgi:hypothetical protein